MPAEAIRLLPFETEFTRAWDTPGHTRYGLPDTDDNRLLAARYMTGRPLTVTHSMLWDMETRKAARPGAYIPFVVRAGSDRSWNRAVSSASRPSVFTTRAPSTLSCATALTSARSCWACVIRGAIRRE